MNKGEFNKTNRASFKPWTKIIVRIEEENTTIEYDLEANGRLKNKMERQKKRSLKREREAVKASGVPFMNTSFSQTAFQTEKQPRFSLFENEQFDHDDDFNLYDFYITEHKHENEFNDQSKVFTDFDQFEIFCDEPFAVPQECLLSIDF